MYIRTNSKEFQVLEQIPKQFSLWLRALMWL